MGFNLEFQHGLAGVAVLSGTRFLTFKLLGLVQNGNARVFPPLSSMSTRLMTTR